MIISGCQRSGTKTAASIFGLTHEGQYDTTTSLSNLSFKDDCSWLAAPFMSAFKSRDIPVIRIVRHPQGVIDSLLAGQFWTSDVATNTLTNGVGADNVPYRDFIYKYLPAIKNFNCPVLKSMYYWINWNKLLKQVPTILIESIMYAPHLNKRPREGSIDITTYRLWPKVKELAIEYGYSIP